MMKEEESGVLIMCPMQRRIGPGDRGRVAKRLVVMTMGLRLRRGDVEELEGEEMGKGSRWR